MKKKSIAVALLLTGTFILSGCNSSNPTVSVSEETTTQTAVTDVNEDIYAVYQLYLNAGGSLSYEAWLETIKGEAGADGKDGADGNGIASVTKTDSVGTADLYTITYTNGTTSMFYITNGKDGADGNGIASITKSASDGIKDTYTIAFTDGSTATFTVTNGVNGDKGDDGNGIASIEKTATEDNIDTYTITFTNGTSTTFAVANGTKGEKGDTGNGVASVTKTGTEGNVDTYTITFTDGTTTTFTVTNGTDGKDLTAEYYTVTFEVEGEVVDTQTIKKGDVPTEPTLNLTKENYHLNGWFYGDEQWNFDFYYHPSDMTLTATWEHDITNLGEVNIWCPENEGATEVFLAKAEKWLADNYYTADLVVTPVAEGNAVTKVLEDSDTAADIYCFYQDSLSRLVLNNKLEAVSTDYASDVATRNNSFGVGIASVDDTLYAYPLTSDNGYIMMYDKSVMGDTDMTSLEAIIAKCESTGTKFDWNLTSIFYSAGFFFAEDSTGTDLCKSEWTIDADGNFTGYTDTFNSDNGLIALKGMYKLLSSSAWQDSAYASDFSAATPASVVITGSWDKSNAVAALGDNYAVTVLPKFTVDGSTYQLGSFGGGRMLGVKPQADATRSAALQGLANYLTDVDSQTALYESLGWGGTNLALENSDAFKADETTSALISQAEYTVPQGNTYGSWWTIANAIATNAKATDGSDDALKTVLTTYATELSDEYELYKKPIWFGANQSWDNRDKASLLTEASGTYTITVTYDASLSYLAGRIVEAATYNAIADCDDLDESSKALMAAGYDDTSTNAERNLIFAEAGTYTITWNGTVLHVEKVTA